MPSNPVPDTNLPTLLVKKPTRSLTTPQHVHLYGTRSKTQANSMILQSSSDDETEDSSILESFLEDTGSFGVMGILFNHISTKLWWLTGSWYLIYSSILHVKIIHFLLLCDPTYMNTVRVNCVHSVLSLGIQGLMLLG